MLFSCFYMFPLEHGFVNCCCFGFFGFAFCLSKQITTEIPPSRHIRHSKLITCILLPRFIIFWSRSQHVFGNPRLLPLNLDVIFGFVCLFAHYEQLSPLMPLVFWSKIRFVDSYWSNLTHFCQTNYELVCSFAKALKQYVYILFFVSFEFRKCIWGRIKNNVSFFICKLNMLGQSHKISSG